MPEAEQKAPGIVLKKMFFSSKYRYLYILGLAAYTFINTEVCEVYSYFQITVRPLEAFLIIFFITFFTWEINRILWPVFQKWFPQPDEIIRRTITFFFTGLVLSCMATASVDVFFAEIVLHQVPGSIMNPLKLTIIYTSLILLLFHLLNLVFVYEREYRQKHDEAEELKRINAQAELQAIKSQVNPHFLFNNLNVLSGLVMQKSNEANKFIEAFSKVYMHILNHSDKELVTLKEELNFLNQYIYLIQQRFPESVKFELQIPAKYDNHYIIPSALQMLVENAIKHNIASMNRPLNITVYANGNQSISVINNLQRKNSPDVRSTNIGLANIRKRYEIITGKSIDITEAESKFIVSLPLIELDKYESSHN